MSASIIEVFPDEKEHEPASTTYWRRQAAEKDVLIRSMREALESIFYEGGELGVAHGIARAALAQVSVSPKEPS